MWETLSWVWDETVWVLGWALALAVTLHVLYGVLSWAAVGIDNNEARKAWRRAAAERALVSAAPWEPYVLTDPSYIQIGVREKKGVAAFGVARRQSELARVPVGAADVAEQIAAAWQRAKDTAALLNDPLAVAEPSPEQIVASWTPPAGSV